ncbi:MAG: YecH family metal-binding protein [Fidelibacterota bacterium]
MTDTMTQPLHAHAILDLIVQNPGGFTPESLRDEIEKRFGPEIRFTNCSGRLFDTTQILQFFTARQKIVINDNHIFPVRQNICNH